MVSFSVKKISALSAGFVFPENLLLLLVVHEQNVKIGRKIIINIFIASLELIEKVVELPT